MNTHRAVEDSSGSAPRADQGGRAVGALLVALGVVAFQLPIFDRWFSHMDEGHVLWFADIVARGGELYRDATLYPLPGAFYLLAWFFEAFGPSIWLSRVIVVFEFALFVAMVWLWMKRCVSPWAALACVFSLLVYRVFAFPHWHVYSYSTTSLLLILAAVLCLLRSFDARSLAWLFAAGLLFGFSVYCKQDYGAAALLVMVPAIVVEARSRTGAPGPVLSPLAVFLGGGALVGAGVGAYFFSSGILGDLLEQTISNHLRGIGAFAYTTYPAPWPLFAQDPALRDSAGLFAFFPGIVTTVDLETLRQNWLFRETYVYDVALKLFYWGPYAFAALAFVRLWRRRVVLRESPPGETRERDAWLSEFVLAGFALAFLCLLTLNRPQDFLHAAVLLWPFLCLAVIRAADLFERRRVLAWSLTAVLLLPSAAVVGYGGRAYMRLRAQNSEPIGLDRAGTRAKPADAAMLRDVTEFIEQRVAPDERVAVLPYFPIAHFLADRLGPDRSAYIVWPFAEFDDRDLRIIDSIERHRVSTVVYNFTQFATFPTMPEFAPDLYAYLVDTFEVVRVFTYDDSGYMLAGLARRSGREPGVSLLDLAWKETAVWIEADEGPPQALPPATRSEYAARERWPFRRTLALRPSLGERRTVFAIPMSISLGDVLRTAISVHPERWFALPAYAAHFRLEVEANGVRRALYERTLDPHNDRGDRRWIEIAAPLDSFAGQEVVLLMSVSVDSPVGESRAMGGWAEPRLVRVDAASSAVAD